MFMCGCIFYAKHITLTHTHTPKKHRHAIYHIQFVLLPPSGHKFNGFIVWNYQLSLHNDHRKFVKLFSLLFRSTGGEKIVFVIFSTSYCLGSLAFSWFLLLFPPGWCCCCCLRHSHITIDRLANWNIIFVFFLEDFYDTTDMICSSATTYLQSSCEWLIQKASQNEI